MDLLLNTVKAVIEEYQMLDKDDRVLVGLSGGYDSVCLCLVLKELGYRVAVAYLNHGIRPEAVQEEAFVQRLSNQLGIMCHIKRVDVCKLAKELGTGLENAGRKARYEFFHKLCNQEGYHKIAVAHTRNDHTETVLLHLTRGSGLKGLIGIPPVRGKIIRPLIRSQRQEIEAYVDQTGIVPMQDATNFQNDYSRNRIRNRVIPELLKINPNLLETVERTSITAFWDLDYLEKAAGSYRTVDQETARIDRNTLLALHPALAARVLIGAYEAVAGSGNDLEKKHLDRIKKVIQEKEHGAVMDLCADVKCYLEYGTLVFAKNKKRTEYQYPLHLNGVTEIEEAGILLDSEIVPAEKYMQCGHNIAAFDYDKINADIWVRNRRIGDRFTPFGMNHEKKLKDFLIDEKIPLAQRDQLPLVVSDRILWVCGYRRSNDCLVEKETKHVLKIHKRNRGK